MFVQFKFCLKFMCNLELNKSCLIESYNIKFKRTNYTKSQKVNSTAKEESNKSLGSKNWFVYKIENSI